MTRYMDWWIHKARNPETGRKFTRPELMELARLMALVMPEPEKKP